MSNAKKKPVMIQAPDWVRNVEAFQAFIDQHFGSARNAADLYGCLGTVVHRVHFEATHNPSGLNMQAEDSWAICQTMMLQRGIGQALGAVDDAGAVVTEMYFTQIGF